MGGQKVKDWLNDHNPDHSFDDLTPNKWLVKIFYVKFLLHVYDISMQ